MRIAKVVNYDVNNGEGFRLSVWVSGCPIKCKGCHNKDLWSEELGTEYCQEVEDKIIELLSDEHILGLSILGGEPLAPYNVEGVIELCNKVRQKLPNKTIWLWTGYDFERVKKLDIEHLFDVVVDGQYIEEEKEANLKWRGSKNQTIHKLK